MMMDKEKLCKVSLGLVGVVVILYVIGAIVNMSWMSWFKDGFDNAVLDYDCDIRSGCNTRALTNREITNIELEKSLEREDDVKPGRLVNENFSFGNYQPGVDRPQIAHLLNSRRLRTEDYMEGLSGRTNSDFVFTQFGNDGTVINPNINPLYRPQLVTGGSAANMPRPAGPKAKYQNI